MLLLALGAAFVALAGLGVLLPLLPTTPFLLLAAWCFARSEPRLLGWLHRSPLFGPLLRDWERERGVRLHVKISAIAMVALAVGATLWAGALRPALQVALVLLAAIGVLVVLRLRTARGPRS